MESRHCAKRVVLNMLANSKSIDMSRNEVTLKDE